MKRQETIENQEALKRVGGLSEPSKMPCYGYSIPASTCKLGSILQRIKGTTCNSCYAMKRAYTWPVVLAAMQRRYNSLSSPTWVADMVRVIRWKEKSGYFRFHDSGDVQSLQHLEKIADVASQLPEIMFWLPTREFAIVKAYIAKHGNFPSNLTVRVSATKIDSAAQACGLPTSGVASDENNVTCQAPKQNNECKDCRACWSKDVSHVVYKQH